MSPLHAAHVDSDGNIMTVISANYSYQLNDWFRGLDLQPGDRVETAALHVRKEEDASVPTVVSGL